MDDSFGDTVDGKSYGEQNYMSEESWNGRKLHLGVAYLDGADGT